MGITWLDAPKEQFARVDKDHKIRCKVQANPAANIDWLKESVVISSGEIHICFYKVFKICVNDRLVFSFLSFAYSIIYNLQ